MSILLDTHVFIWAAGGERRLSPAATALLEDSNEVIFLSAVSSWEISIKWSKGSLELPQPPGIFIREAIANAGISQLAITVDDSCVVADLPFHHRDPFDRLLIAQARSNGLRIFSSDPVFKKYEVDVFWL